MPISNSELNRFRQAVIDTENIKKERDEFRRGKYIDAKVEFEIAKRRRREWARHYVHEMTYDEADQAESNASFEFRKAASKLRDLKSEANRRRTNLKARIKRAADKWDDDAWDANIDLINRAKRAAMNVSLD